MGVNNLAGLDQLRNAYFAMRHARSVANERGIIVSHPEHGVDAYGLSRAGREQVNAWVHDSAWLDKDARIISSDFLRARQTAELVRLKLGASARIVIDVRLRERNFGAFELGPDDRYLAVWVQDRRDPGHTCSGVESAASVMRRTTALVADLEGAYSAEAFVLVSHGDPLQILHAAFLRRPASLHRDIPAIGTAEIKRLVLAPA